MLVELLSCDGCWRVWDDRNYTFGCKTCFCKKCHRAGPTKFNLFRWFVSDPKHVIKLLIQDLREKDHE